MLLSKKDVAWFDETLSNEWANNVDGQIVRKAQLLADLKSGALKVESAAVSDMKVLVFGEVAVVHGLGTEKSSYRGKDTSGQERYTDVFVKCDGRWQCVTGYSTKVQ